MKSSIEVTDSHPSDDSRLLESMLNDLAARFAPSVARTYEALLGIHFDTELFQKLHTRVTNRSLVERHSFPFFLALSDMGVDHSIFTEYLVSALLAHTSPITHLDAYTDKSLGLSTNPETLVEDAGYSLAALYRAASVAASLQHGPTLLAECFPLSAFIAERMFLDSSERPYVVPPEADVFQLREDYLTSRESRLLGCGYFEVMARAALASQGVKADSTTLESLRCLRMLRQLTDEIIDLTEDLDAGIMTLPALLLLEEDYATTAPILDAFKAAEDEKLLHKQLQSSSVPRELYERCIHLYNQGSTLWRDRWGQTAHFPILFDIRMAYLRQEATRSIPWMAQAAWHNEA